MRAHELNDALRQPAGILDLGARYTRTVGSDGDGTAAKGQLRRLGDDGAIDAAAESHRRGAETAQHFQEPIALAGQLGRHGRQVGCRGTHKVMICHLRQLLKPRAV